MSDVEKDKSIEGEKSKDSAVVSGSIEIKEQGDKVSDRVKELVGDDVGNKELERNPEDVEAKVDKVEGFTPQYSLYKEPGEFSVPEADKEELRKAIDVQAVKGFESLGRWEKFKSSLFSGHTVASEHDYTCGTASYSTKTSIAEVNGSKYFVVYNYPGSGRHRNADTGCRKAWGEKALKASEEEWRDTFVSRSLLPVTEGENERIAVLPFIPNISIIDILEKYDDSKFKGNYEFGHQFKELDAKKEVVKEVSSALKELHDSGRTWGEVIPANLGVSNEGKVLFFDPETPYVEGTPEIEQKARDIWSWCMSSCGALNRSEHDYDDYSSLIENVFEAYGDKEVIDYMKENLSDNLSFWKLLRHPIAWGQFKARLTTSSRKQYNTIMEAIRTSN